MNYGMTDPEATGIGGGVGSAGSASWTTFCVGVADVAKALDRAKSLAARSSCPSRSYPT
jgi:hypothetical protein